MNHFNSSAFRFNVSLLPHHSNQNIKTNLHMIKTIVHSAGGGYGGGGGRAGAGMYHTSCSTGGVGAAADEVALAPPRAVGRRRHQRSARERPRHDLQRQRTRHCLSDLLCHPNSSAFRFNVSLLPHYANHNIKTNS